MAKNHCLLLTPGPLTTNPSVRAKAVNDYGSRCPHFIKDIQTIHTQLVDLVEGSHDEFVAVMMQGSGTFSVEGAIGTFVPRDDGKLLVLCNGAYGRRIVEICGRIGRQCVSLTWDEDTPVDVSAVETALATDLSISHVAVIHCETTAGLLNDIEGVGRVVAAAGRRFIIDSMSAFGALPLSAKKIKFDCMVASSNKCLEGIPGFGFAICRRSALSETKGNCHSLAMDFHAQANRFAVDSQFRFTPPTQAIAAFAEALRLHKLEGGVEARGRKYRENCDILVRGLTDLGFKVYLRAEVQAPIIVTFLSPTVEQGFSFGQGAWNFEKVYNMLDERGFSIYPGKLTNADTFRVGCIGQVSPTDMRRFVATFRDVVAECGVTTPSQVHIPSVTAVIFDMAGTTVDFGSCAPVGVFAEVFKQNGVDVTNAEVRGPMGTHKREHIRRMLTVPRVLDAWRAAHGGADPTDAQIDAMYEAMGPLALSTLPHYCQPITGVVDMFRTVKASGVAIAATSGYNRAMVDIALQSAGEDYRTLLQATVAASEVAQGRPAPYMLYKAMEAIGVTERHQCVAVGDTVPDIDAGHNAGFWVVGTYMSGNAVGLSEPELTAKTPAEREKLALPAKSLLSRAHYLIESSAELPAVLADINRRLARGERP